jgi:hypothetical protein
MRANKKYHIPELKVRTDDITYTGNNSMLLYKKDLNYY